MDGLVILAMLRIYCPIQKVVMPLAQNLREKSKLETPKHLSPLNKKHCSVTVNGKSEGLSAPHGVERLCRGLRRGLCGRRALYRT